MAEDVFQREYKRLNSAQKQAVDAIEGPVLVVAGPGSGKTQILSLRVGNILLKTDTRASNILCLTFTESAAANMRERLAELIGTEAYHVAIFTFHGFAVDIIKRFPEFFYGGAFFTPADPVTQIDVLEDILKNLHHNDPLRSFHPEQGFVYRRDIQQTIQYLKKGGISPQDFVEIIEENKSEFSFINKIITKLFENRISMKQLDAFVAAQNELEKSKKTLAGILAISLKYAIDEAESLGKTTPLTGWKDEYVKKDNENASVFRDSVYLEKMVSLANIFSLYQVAMHEKGFYDFDDMLLDVLAALEKHPELRYQIQEQFQYVLVDEFQDTNSAQMKIIRLITDAPVHEGRPNVMAVGDDDQAIYKFQGAEVSNILEFEKMFKDPVVVTMTGNYRSSQSILDIARKIILKGENRLEKRIQGMDKTLKALGEDALIADNVSFNLYPTEAHEFTGIAQSVSKLITSGVSPESIALITRNHSELVSVVPYLKSARVPIRYEREQNIFEEPHIKQIITIARFLTHSLSGHIETAESFIPAIVSFPFWEAPREEIWRVSIEARKNHESWLVSLGKSEHAALRRVYHFLVDSAAASQFEPLEKILDLIVGSHVPIQRESDDGEDDPLYVIAEDNMNRSPFRDFYFSRKNFEQKRAEYLSFLSSLRVFISALREYKQGKTLSIVDLVEFVDVHEKNSLSLHDQSPFASAEEAVSLMTAHKAKGLEFDHVFVLSCQQDVWVGKSRGTRLPLPTNLPLAPAGDNLDDQLRLFYVALTIAKKALHLSSYELDEKGRSVHAIGFLSDVLHGTKLSQSEVPDSHDVLTSEWVSFHTPPFFGEEKALLHALLADYMMSITHLNNFLDVTKGGPQYFLEQNLLRFPQAKTPASSYGSVIHKIIELIYGHVKSEKILPTLDTVLDWYKKGLQRERLSPSDYNTYLTRGQDVIETFFDNKKESFDASHKIEVDFSKQGVICTDKDKTVQLSGKIDKMVLSGNEIIVHDFKTGTAKESWMGVNDYEKIQLRNYKNQLIFYKILVEGSREFSRYKVNRGVLEFVEPTKKKELVDLALDITTDDVDHLRALILAVYNKIINLDFPDTSQYEKSIHGVLSFEEDLLR